MGPDLPSPTSVIPPPLNKEQGESAARGTRSDQSLVSSLAQSDVPQEEGSQAGRRRVRCKRQACRGRVYCKRHSRLPLWVSDVGILPPNIPLHICPRMSPRIAPLSIPKVELPSSSPNPLLCWVPCHTDDKVAPISKARRKDGVCPLSSRFSSPESSNH